eukprot:8564160-Prorocentrum_lima.AAC.1
MVLASGAMPPLVPTILESTTTCPGHTLSGTTIPLAAASSLRRSTRGYIEEVTGSHASSPSLIAW